MVYCVYARLKKLTNRDLKWVSIYVNFHRYTKLVVLKNIENLSIQEIAVEEQPVVPLDRKSVV